MEIHTEEHHPIDSFIHTELIHSMWCSGCGNGTVVYALINALKEAKYDFSKVSVISGIGCTGKVTDYIKLSSLNAKEMSVIKYAADFKFKHSDQNVIALVNNADFLLDGAKSFIEAGNDSANILVIHINNCIYLITDNAIVPITPFMRFSVNGDFELPFNLPHLAKTCHSDYVARWTPLRTGWLKYSMIEGLSKKGFSYIEIISPCVIYNVTDRRIEDPVRRMAFYDKNAIIKSWEKTENLDLRDGNRIIIGKFINK